MTKEQIAEAAEDSQRKRRINFATFAFSFSPHSAISNIREDAETSRDSANHE
jgi:hypothetical protein